MGSDVRTRVMIDAAIQNSEKKSGRDRIDRKEVRGRRKEEEGRSRE